MAALTSAGVKIVETWKEGGTSGRKFLVRKATLTLSTQGGATNNIPAKLFGMRTIWYARAGVKSDSTRQEFVPSYNGALLQTFAAGSATTADVTGTFSVIVAGKD